MNRRLVLAAIAAGIGLAGCAALMPPKSVTDTAAADPNFTTLTRLIDEAGLADTLRGPGPFTVFAPTDEAFRQLPAATMDALAKDKKQLAAVLGYHVVGTRLMAADIKPGSLKTLGGADLPISLTADFVGVDQALVTKADVEAANGVIHVIDRVLVPPRR